jgi:hypothetical protein
MLTRFLAGQQPKAKGDQSWTTIFVFLLPAIGAHWWLEQRLKHGRK